MIQHVRERFSCSDCEMIAQAPAPFHPTNNAAERAIQPIAVGRRSWTFASSDAGGYRAAALYTLNETAKLNGIDAQAWLADVLSHLPDHPARHIDDLLPWNWTPPQSKQVAA